MDLQVFQEFYDIGIMAIPIIWDSEKRIAAGHPEHDLKKIAVNIKYVDDLITGRIENFKHFANSNAIALKMNPPFGMFDFDLKNTDNKTVYSDWYQMVCAINEDIFRKVCIEKTRSGGFHVYIKYEKLDHKIPLARSNDKEVISVYTGELLSYCTPTPGYSIVHNGWDDIDFLTDAEFNVLVTCAAFFNEDKEFKPGESAIQLIDYPVEYESTCLQFDQRISPDLFEVLLNSIGLFRNKDQRQFDKKKWLAFTREGSLSGYSAKVYLHSKRCLIFSASMPNYPCWHDSAKMGDKKWSLSPAKLVYYKNRKDWTATIDEIKCICDSANIELTFPSPITEQSISVNEDRLKFPFDIFPDAVSNYISHQTIQHEYIACALLSAMSTAIGNSVQLEALEGYIVKPILYMAIVAPPGASKTPALKKAFAPLEKFDAILYANHKGLLADYRQNLADAKKAKSEEPVQPPMKQALIKDSTIEMVIKILSTNDKGCCVYADELSGFLKRMNQYKDGDEVQKWLELWSGSPVLVQRMSREENKVQEPFCNVCGGIQPGVLESLSKDDNRHNGFYHRFLFCYPKPQDKVEFKLMNTPWAVNEDYYKFFSLLLSLREQDQNTYILTQASFDLYKHWFDFKNKKYNMAVTDDIKGIIAKYQDYCLRFAILIQAINETEPSGMVSHISMNGAIRLTEYFLGNMLKALKLLNPDTPLDKLDEKWQAVYNKIPVVFTTKTLVTICSDFGIKESAAKMFLQRQLKKLFTMIKHGEYEKLL